MIKMELNPEDTHMNRARINYFGELVSRMPIRTQLVIIFKTMWAIAWNSRLPATARETLRISIADSGKVSVVIDRE